MSKEVQLAELKRMRFAAEDCRLRGLHEYNDAEFCRYCGVAKNENVARVYGAFRKEASVTDWPSPDEDVEDWLERTKVERHSRLRRTPAPDKRELALVQRLERHLQLLSQLGTKWFGATEGDYRAAGL